MPDFDAVRIEPRLHLFADQTAVDGIRIAVDVDHAARADADFHAQAAVQPLLRQGLERRQLFLVPCAARGVAFGHDVLQERQQLLATGEVTTAAQQQSLVHRVLEVSMGRLGVAVLVSLTHIDSLTCQAIMIEQRLVPGLKLTLHRQVVHSRA
jgi:hypothetical protein